MIKNADGYNDPTVDKAFSNVLKKPVSEQEARAERKNVLDQFKKHVITSKVAMDGLRRCDEVLAQLQKKRKRAKKS